MWTALDLGEHLCLVSVFTVWRRVPDFVGIPGIAHIISSFIDPLPLWTVETAMAKGHAGLVQRVAFAGRGELPDDFLYDSLCNERVDCAARDGDLDTIIRFVTFVPDLILCRAPREVAANRHMGILEWLYENPCSVCWIVDASRMAACRGHLAILGGWTTGFHSRLTVIS
jgi:hypothetical protein